MPFGGRAGGDEVKCWITSGEGPAQRPSGCLSGLVGETEERGSGWVAMVAPLWESCSLLTGGFTECLAVFPVLPYAGCGTSYSLGSWSLVFGHASCSVPDVGGGKLKNTLLGLA